MKLTTLKLEIGLSPYPPPSIYWNLRVSGEMRFDLWAAIGYGQNLEPVRLRAAVGADLACVTLEVWRV